MSAVFLAKLAVVLLYVILTSAGLLGYSQGVESDTDINRFSLACSLGIGGLMLLMLWVFLQREQREKKGSGCNPSFPKCIYQRRSRIGPDQEDQS